MNDMEDLQSKVKAAKYTIGCAIYFNDSSDYLPALYKAYRELGGNDETIDVDIPKEINDESEAIERKNDEIARNGTN